MATSEAQKRANIKYDAVNTKKVCFKFNLHTDKDILDKLDSVPNKQGYIKQCIRENIKRQSSLDNLITV